MRMDGRRRRRSACLCVRYTIWAHCAEHYGYGACSNWSISARLLGSKGTQWVRVVRPSQRLCQPANNMTFLLLLRLSSISSALLTSLLLSLSLGQTFVSYVRTTHKGIARQLTLKLTSSIYVRTKQTRSFSSSLFLLLLLLLLSFSWAKWLS